MWHMCVNIGNNIGIQNYEEIRWNKRDWIDAVNFCPVSAEMGIWLAYGLKMWWSGALPACDGNATDTASSSRSYALYFFWAEFSFLEKKARGCQALSNRYSSGSGGVRDECKGHGVCHLSDAWQILLELFKGPVELRGPNDGIGTLDSRAGESVMKWYPNSSSVRQRTHG
jgi:hypothetical protein